MKKKNQSRKSWEGEVRSGGRRIGRLKRWIGRVRRRMGGKRIGRRKTLEEDGRDEEEEDRKEE